MTKTAEERAMNEKQRAAHIFNRLGTMLVINDTSENAVKFIEKELKAHGDSERAAALREALLANCPACRGDMPNSEEVVFVRGDNIFKHPGLGAADDMYPCGSVGIRALMEDA